MTAFTIKSSISGIEHTREIDITFRQYQLWANGSVPIQRMFPHLSDDDREFLLTGITPEEWDEAFKEEEEIEGPHVPGEPEEIDIVDRDSTGPDTDQSMVKDRPSRQRSGPDVAEGGDDHH